MGLLSLALVLLGCAAGPGVARAQTIVTIGSSLGYPMSVAVDRSGNVFVADGFSYKIKEISAASGLTAVDALSPGFMLPSGMAFDAGGNLFVADSFGDQVVEVYAAGGYVDTRVLAGGFFGVGGVAVDAAGDVFLTDTGNNAVKEILAVHGSIPASPSVISIGQGFVDPTGLAIDAAGNLFVAEPQGQAVKEIIAAGGYATVRTIGEGFFFPNGVALDAAGNLFVADTDNNAVKEILAAGDYTTVLTLGSGFALPGGVAVDKHGTVVVADSGNFAVKALLQAPPLLAAVLPGARSVQLGTAATVFATMINAGPVDLGNCQVSLQFSNSPTGLAFDFQATDPVTNALTGTIDTPVTVPHGNGTRSFLLSFRGKAAFSAPGLSPVFTCDQVPAATTIPGVNTVDLVMSSNPIADIVALAATPTQNGVIALPVNGSAAFAVASSNVGVTAPIIVSVDTGAAVLPITATLCQTDPATAQCLAIPAATVSLSYAGGSTPTFSIFLQSTGAIPFQPSTSRLFVRFKDASGGLHGATSVAVETL